MSGFDYTGRDFLSIRDGLTEYMKKRVPDWSADPSDFAYAILEGVAYLGDMLSYYTDRAAQESNILTANSPDNVFNLSRLFGYSPGLSESAWCTATFTNKGEEDVTISAGTKIGAFGGGYGYELQGEVFLRPGDSREATVMEGSSRYADLGVSDGSVNQKFLLPDSNIDGRLGTMSVTLSNPADPTDQEYWSYREILIDAPAGEYCFSVKVNPNGLASVVFGDGVSGRVPPEGWSVGINYRTTSGAAGNAPGAKLTRFLASWDDPGMAELANVEVIGESPQGGQDIESLDSIRAGTVLLAGTQRRAVTSWDYESLARAESKVLDAVCETRIWSRPTIWFAPRESRLLLEKYSDRLDVLVDLLQQTFNNVSLAGVDPDIQLALPMFFKVQVEIIVSESVDPEYATQQTRTAIMDKFAYGTGLLDESVPMDNIIRAISLGVPTSVVQFARVVGFWILADNDNWSKVLEGTMDPPGWEWPGAGWTPVSEVDPNYRQFAVINQEDHINVLVVKNKSSGRSRF